MKLTTERLKELIKEEMAQQDMVAQEPNVDNSIVVHLAMIIGRERQQTDESKAHEILDVLKEKGLLSKDPRLSQS